MVVRGVMRGMVEAEARGTGCFIVYNGVASF